MKMAPPGAIFIPAHAGIQQFWARERPSSRWIWTPAFAGVAGREDNPVLSPTGPIMTRSMAPRVIRTGA